MATALTRVLSHGSRLFIILAAGILIATSTSSAETVLFSTGFEASEGYVGDSDLSGSNGWIGDGADGILTNLFNWGGQQAYIGFAPPRGSTNDFYTVYRPVNLAPVPAQQSLLKFSVRMQIVDSSATNGPWDDFRWSVYNTNGTRLFSLDFDNASLQVSYLLDDGKGFVSTETQFDTQGYYDLVVSMNFARNLWTAILNDQVIVNAKPITTMNSPLNFGDVDAVWAVRNPASPGDNYMLFDDYSISADGLPSIPAKLESTGRDLLGGYRARLFGEPGLVYHVETSTDLVHWEAMVTFTAPAGGVLDFQDPAAGADSQRFYRARQSP